MEIKIPREKKICSLECSKYQCFESVQNVSNGPRVYSVQCGNLGEPFEGFRSPPPLPPQSHPHQTTPQKSAQIVSFSVFSPPHHEFDKIYYLWSNCKRLYGSWLCMVTTRLITSMNNSLPSNQNITVIGRTSTDAQSHNLLKLTNQIRSGVCVRET